MSTEEYWEEFSTQFKPQLSEKVVIADRQQEADALIARLRGQAESFMLGAETSEEVIAFAVAAIRSAEPGVRESLESRTLITRTEAAARFLAMHSKMVFIATGAAESLAGVLAWTPMNSCAQAVTREGQPAELLALVATVAFRSAARPCA